MDLSSWAHCQLSGWHSLQTSATCWRMTSKTDAMSLGGRTAPLASLAVSSSCMSKIEILHCQKEEDLPVLKRKTLKCRLTAFHFLLGKGATMPAFIICALFCPLFCNVGESAHVIKKMKKLCRQQYTPSIN